MAAGLTVGDFSRITHLSVKTLRHYHEVGLLEPTTVNSGTGYRYYSADQIPTAQVIRRLRDLENRECPGWQGRDDDGGAQSARTAPAHPPRQW